MEYTEKEVVALTGYSRITLQALRLGGKQKKRGKTYASAPVLEQGKDWRRFGRTVIYTAEGLRAIKQNRKS